MMKKIARLGVQSVGYVVAAALLIGVFTDLGLHALMGRFNSEGDQSDSMAMSAVLGIKSAIAQGFTLPDGTVINGKLIAQGKPPTVNSGTVTAGSSDFMGQITAGGATAVITFSAAFAAAPTCMIVDATAPSTGLKYTVATTAITITGGMTTSDKVNYICMGHQAR